MKEIISIINQKGGVGKSTTALSLGTGLKRLGFKILFIDLDPQCNLTYTLGIDSPDETVMQLLTGISKPEKTIYSANPDMDIIPGSPLLSGADTVISQTGKEYKLKENLESLYENYDYIIIDTPPALGILTVNALTASTGIIIPAQADIFSLQGINQLSGTIAAIRKYCNPSLEIIGILLTRYNARSIISRDISEMTENVAIELSTKVFNTKIRECTAIKESQVIRQCIFDYAPKSNACIDYSNLINEIIGE